MVLSVGGATDERHLAGCGPVESGRRRPIRARIVCSWVPCSAGPRGKPATSGLLAPLAVDSTNSTVKCANRLSFDPVNGSSAGAGAIE